MFNVLRVLAIHKIEMAAAETEASEVIHGNCSKISRSKLDEYFLLFSNDALNVAEVAEYIVNLPKSHPFFQVI